MAVKRGGQIALTPFPYTDLSGAKLRPVLMLRQASRFDDWLVCMVSSKIDQAEAGFDEVLTPADVDFAVIASADRCTCATSTRATGGSPPQGNRYRSSLLS